MCSCRCGTVGVVEFLSLWKHAYVCSCACGTVVIVVDVLSSWNYACVGGCMCGNVVVVVVEFCRHGNRHVCVVVGVELLLSWS